MPRRLAATRVAVCLVLLLGLWPLAPRPADAKIFQALVAAAGKATVPALEAALESTGA